MSKQTKAWICDAVRTPIGRYGGALSSVRTDDLGAVPIAALIKRNPNLPPEKIDDLIYGCANQAGEDNRNVARMSLLLAGVPPSVPAATVNRLCGSGMNTLGNAAHAIKAGGAHVVVAGGVESMSRAPFVLAKATAAFGRNAEIHDTTLGWRFVNKKTRTTIWHRFHGRDRRERGRRIQSEQGRAGSVLHCAASKKRRRQWPQAG